jgi:sortase A
MKARTGIRRAQYGFAGIGIIALGYCAAVWWNARFYQQSSARIFDREREPTNSAAIPHPIRQAPALKEGGLVGRLEIPRIGVSVMVVEGVGRSDLEHAAGHIPGTAFPGDSGNVGIAGHRDTFFRPLAAIHPGDTMTLGTTKGVYQYQVNSTEIVRPEDISVLYPTGQDMLTLVTCYPFHYIGAAPKRFIVHAVRLPASG